MRVNLDRAIKFILADEGGYAERPGEPGGAVHMGISMRTLSDWRAMHDRPRPSFADLKAMSEDEAAAIYSMNYALPLHFETMPAGLDYAILDAAVNEGVEGARGLLAVTTRVRDVAARIKTISTIRLVVKQQLPSWEVNGKGWTARIGERVVQRATAMVNG
jgi:lysozyme family protein